MPGHAPVGRSALRWIELSLVAVLLAAASSACADSPKQWAPGELIVKFRPGVAATEKAALVNGRLVREFRFIGAEYWKTGGDDPLAMAASLLADPRVEYAEPNWLIHSLEVPDDTLFDQLWGLHNTGQTIGGVTGIPDADIDAVEAWDVFTGSSTSVVAVIDTGIDYLHPDLAANIWTNPGEVAGNALDDDGNGFIDDIRGWDFVNNDNDPMDDNSHGSHCAGTIGAVADNGIGVAGVNWNVRIMAVKAQGADNVGTNADAISSIEYATRMGVDVINCSWGNNFPSVSLDAALLAAQDADIFVVASAGNFGTNNDYAPQYPSNSEAANVIAVMASNNRDHRAIESTWSSNYGPVTVDIAAPGVRIWSTARNGAYMYLSGTSMAAPHVAGAMALLRGRFPGISVAEGKAKLMTIGNDPLPSLAGLCVTGARLNLHRLIADPDVLPPSPITDLAIVEAGSNRLTLAWTTPPDNGEIRNHEVRYALSPIVDEADWDAATQVAGEAVPAGPGASMNLPVAGLSAATTYYFSVRARDDYGNLGGLSNSPAGTTLAAPTITVSPVALTATTPPGSIATRTFTVANTGAGVLDFAIPGNVPSKSAGDARAVTNGAGGPDRFGYHWADSDTPDGPAFDWIDISSIGIGITMPDNSNDGPFDIGFVFPFYGAEHTTFRIGSNGYVSLSSSEAIADNTALPSTTAPFNLLALFWDGLSQGMGTCHYHGDGTRLIIQYTNWERAGGGGPFTMQMHLYPSGIFEYHYLAMPAQGSGSATIGIQNGDGSDGLTVALDADYAHDGLAIRFAYLPYWVRISPAGGSLAAGESLEISATFDATHLCGSGFNADIHVLSNDPLQGDVVVPAHLVLTGAQDIAVSPASLAFGPVNVFETATLDLTVTNRGCSDLTIAGADFGSSPFSGAQEWPLTVPAKSAINLPVTFAPMASGPASGLLVLSSDDPDTPTITIALGGTGLDVPDIAVEPASLTATLPLDGRTTRELTLTNLGAGDLHFTIPVSEYVPLAAGNRTSGPGAAAANGAGGPDASGYRWKDSDDLHGPAYDWVEIAAIGTRIPFATSEQTLGPYSLGFSFPFHGASFTEFHVCSNGWISFTDGSSVDYLNLSLPNTLAPPNMIAPFWDSLLFTVGTGSAWYHNDGSRLVVEYLDVPCRDAAGTATFQVHLYPTGRVEFHYRKMTVPLNRATVGMQDGTRTVGLTVVHNAAYLHDALAIRFDAVPHWLTAAPSTGTLASGESIPVTVAIDAAGLCGRTYTANLHVLSNDPDLPDLAVPVSLEVPATPAARVFPAQWAFGDVFLGQDAAMAVEVTNAGCDHLQVTGLSIDGPDFTTDTAAPFAVEPGAALAVNVAFAPAAAGARTGTLTLTTNDATRPTLAVPLSGNGLVPATIVVQPGSISLDIPSGQQRTATIRIENHGDGTLSYTVPVPDLYSKTTARAMAAAPGAGLPSGAPPIGTGTIPLGSGGPDAFGYEWIDSDAIGGPEFDWIDIGNTGTVALATGDDANEGPFPIGFTFRFYDEQYSTFRVCSNGWLSFSSPATTRANRALPDTLAPRSLLAPFWDDLDLDAAGSGDVIYGNVDGNLVVQWDGVMRFGVTQPVTFQVILKPNGTMIYQYESVGAAITNSATVGIQDATGTTGLQAAFNAEYLHDGLAIRFSALPAWALVSPSSGAIPPDGSVELTVTLDTTGLEPGPHSGLVRIRSNDASNPEVQVPLTITVANDDPGDDDDLPSRISLSQNAPNPFNPETVIRIGLPERDTIQLRIFDVRGKLVRTLAEGELDAGFHDYAWQGRGDDGARVPSGVYLYRLSTSAGIVTRRMTLVK